MKLNLEKQVKVAVEVNNSKFINLEDGILYQHMDDEEIYLFIKSKTEPKEIKIKIEKDHEIKEQEDGLQNTT